jgi:hypothetical protein
MKTDARFHRLDKCLGVLSVVYTGVESEIDDVEKRVNGQTNMEAMNSMSPDEFTVLLNDMLHYDDPDHVWESNLKPPLPFEDWADWLVRRADFMEAKTWEEKENLS